SYSAEERRVALVIGNGAYNTAPLRNPVNDAEDMARALRSVGFEVILKLNADRRDMLLAIEEFGQKLVSSQAALFFFSGHGMQIKGRTYIFPVRAAILQEIDVEVECVDVNRVLGRMEGPESRVNIIVLDACRNNPFARKFRSEARGLARMDAPKGTLLAFSTDPGNVADDGTGRNSPYTAALIQYLKVPGLGLE
ncbi:MAG: caspase family protein, partial [Pseudomonadota bacterium]